MSAVVSELGTLAFFLVAGWAALWPARRSLGAAGYHIAALPTGLLSAAAAGAFAAISNRPLDGVSAAVGAMLLITVVQGFLRVSGTSSDHFGRFDPRSFAFAGGSFGLLALIVGVIRLTVSNNDSIVSYWPLGVGLSRNGEFTTSLIASRSVLIPSMNAIHATFGSEWAYVIYPMLAATMLCWVVLTLASGPLSGAPRRTVRLVAGGAVLALAIEPSFIFHSLFVHSHMVSGIYLLMALTSIWMAVRPGSGGSEANLAYLVLAGVFTAALAHGRPDGLAYQFVPVAAAVSALTVTRVEWKRVLAYFGPLLVIVASVYAAAFIDLGVWGSSKLSGRTSLGILVVLGLASAGPWIVQALERVTKVGLTGERFLAVLVSVSAIMTVVILGARWDTASGALATARVNLFQGAGGYHYLWYGVVGLLALSVLTGDALRPGSWTRPAFLSVALFFIVAAVVHGLSHEGRIGVGDSFNRVAFHVLPLVVWFVAAAVGRIVGQGSEAGTAAAAVAD